MKRSLSREITELLSQAQIVKHLSRQKCMASCILALIVSRRVHLCELAEHLNDQVDAKSNEIRLQDFFREVSFDYGRVGWLLSQFLPSGKKVSLTVDRTEWDFGKCQVNILMVVASHGYLHVPLYWELLDNKSGNSSTADRIDQIKQCVELLGAQRIGLVTADREFVGHVWFRYLKDQHIPFCVRMPKSHKITDLECNTYMVEELMGKRKERYFAHVMVDGVWGNAYIKKLKDQDEWLFIFGTAKMDYLGQFYRRRWRIETFFQSLKTRGFNLEDTHLKALEKLKKLLAVVCIAFAFCFATGCCLHQKQKPIKTKKHGYKANSFFRHGLNFIRECLKSKEQSKRKLQKQALERLALIFVRWLNWQLVKNEYPIKYQPVLKIVG